MNERFWELAKRADVLIDYGDDITVGRYSIGGSTEKMKKFAELIVRECANRLRETDYELMFVEDGMCDPSISDAMLVAASDIEEHLGVDNGE
jgi:hypothetical protein